VEGRQPFLHRVGEAGARFGTKPPRSRKVRLALQIGLAVLIFGFLVLTVVDQWSEIQKEGVHFHVGWLAPAIVILPGFYVLSALGWDLTLRFLGYPLGVGRAQVAWGQPLLARYVPGSVLYVLGRVLLSEKAGIPRRITIASIVYEQAISATSAIVVASYFIIKHPDLQGDAWRWGVLLLIPAAIVFEASLSFLGVGVPPPTADWGSMISDASGFFQYGYWWFLLFPSLALLTTTLAFNIFGDSVRDALDPRGAGIYV